jgi:hypothetical protein
MRALLTLSLGMLLLSSCGRVFCVGPFGPVDECYADPQSSSGSSGSTTAFHIAVSPTQYQGVNSPAGTQLTLVATNGAGTGTYSWVATAVTAASTAPTFTNSAGSATAPITGTTTYFTSAASTTGDYRITVTDGANGTTATTFITFP